MNKLDSGGTCLKCKKDAQNEHMECWLCKNRYHVIECEGEEPMVAPSFLKSRWPTISRKWPCITFTCHNCREEAHTKEDLIMSRRVTLVEEMALKTSKQLDDIMDILSAPKEITPTQGKSYAAAASSGEAPSLIIVEKPEENLTTAEKKKKMEELKKAAIQSKAAIKATYTNKSGKTVVLCNNEKSKEAMLPHVTKVFTSSKVITPSPKLPTVSIPFIEGNYAKEELIEAINNQNEGNGISLDDSNTKVIFISPMKDQGEDGLHQAVLRVSEEIREKLKDNGNRIFIGSTSCPVYDRFFVKRCNRCQAFHHYHKECRKNEVCAKCAGRHDTRKCTLSTDDYKCINCSTAGFEDIGHQASSFDCPAYVAEQERLKKSIHYYSKNS